MGPLIARSWSVIRAHPVIASSLGGAVLLSMASMLFGIGVVATPWFACEIFAFQLGHLTGRPATRSAAWIRAGIFVLGMVGVVIAATWIAALAIGPDVSTADSASAPLPWPQAVRSVALIAAVTATAIGFFSPFLYAPLVLIERGGTVGAAVLESAWLVRRGGLARHWALAFLAHLMPLVPAIVFSVVVARTYERAATPLGVLAALPLLPLSIPLGQGLVAAAYVQRRRELSERRWTRREGRPPAALVSTLVFLVLAPMLSVLFLAVGALRPAPLVAGPASEGHVVLEQGVEDAAELHVRNTTLSIHVRGRELEVRAGDGAAVNLSGPWRTSIDRVRVRRHGDYYAVEVHADGWWRAEVDRAAMRVDDTVSARLSARLPPWGLPAIGLSFALSALLLVRALEPLGAVRRLYGAPASERPPLDVLRKRRAEAIRIAWRVALVLTPPNLLALGAGALGLLG